MKEQKKRLGRGAALLAEACAIAALAGSTPVSPGPEQDPPTLEYTLVRVFGSESWSIRHTALSPDGCWIAFTEGDEKKRLNIWLLSTEGGEPIPLTKGPYMDFSPEWFPTSDRIAFQSNRQSIGPIMTIPIDPLTGRATGPLRQVTLDGVSAHFDVSPDGKWIAYTVRGEKGRHALRILPSNGGRARTLADPAGIVPIWSPDGRSIYYWMWRTLYTQNTLFRVAVDGGPPEEIFTWPRVIWVMPRSPNKSFFLRAPPERSEYERAWEIATLDGRAIGRLPLPDKMTVEGISTEGDLILAQMEDWVAPLTILPVEGGPAFQLAEGEAYNEPLGWTPDGKNVLFAARMDNAGAKSMLFYAPLDGGPMHQVELPEERMRMSRFFPKPFRDGKHVLYPVDEGGGELLTLKVYSIEEDWSWELTRECVRRAGYRGNGDDILFFEEGEEGYYELYASSARGPSRRLKTFAEIPRIMTVCGDRIAYVENDNKKLLHVTTTGDKAVDRVLTLEGLLDALAWSPDGNRLAAAYYSTSPQSPEGAYLAIMNVTPSGETSGKLEKYRVPGGHWWSPNWLPSGRGIVVAAGDGNLWLITLDPGARPVNLTADDPNSVWRYKLSPDGRTIAYPSEIQQGSSIWLMTLKEPLPGNQD